MIDVDKLACQLAVAMIGGPIEQSEELVRVAKEKGYTTAQGIAVAAYEIADALEAERVSREDEGE